MTQSTANTEPAQDRRLILHAIYEIQDADACLLIGPSRDGVSKAMAHHRAAIKNLMQAIGVWEGAA